MNIKSSNRSYILKFILYFISLQLSRITTSGVFRFLIHSQPTRQSSDWPIAKTA